MKILFPPPPCGAWSLFLIIIILTLEGFPAVAQQTASTAAQQTASIRGSVVDAETGEPLAGANVYLESNRRGAVTNARGRFIIDDVAPGRHVVISRFVGYRTYRRDVSVESGETADVKIRLEVESIMMQNAIVSATRELQSKAEVPVSIGSVDRREIASTNPAHPSDIMSRIPGVWVNQTTGEGHMTSIRQPLSITPLYLYLENGVPTRSTGFFNHNALNEINVPQADRVEVIKGPGTALYGSDAIGGVISVTSSPAPAELEAALSLEGGSHGFKRALISGGTTVGRNGFRLDVNITDSEGWQHATDYSRQSATLRWDRRIGAASLLRTVASFSHVDQGPAGPAAISEEDFNSNPRLNYQPISFREVQAYRISVAYEHYRANALLSITPYGRFNTMDLLPNWSLTFDPATWETQNYSVGALLKYRHDFDPMRTRVILGADLDLSPGERIEHSILPMREGKIFTSYEPGEAIYDYDVTYRQASPYVHAEFSPVGRVRASAGLRIDVLGYVYDNNLSVVDSGLHRRPASASPSFVHASPKLGVTYQMDDYLSAFTAYRHAFRVPSELQLFRQGSTAGTADLKPVKVDNFEAGVRGRIPAGVDFDVAAYYMIKGNDIVYFVNPDGTRGTVNAGETSHRGIEVGVGASPLRFIDLDLSYAYAVHEYEKWETQVDEDYSGNEMELAPRVILNASLAFHVPVLDGASLALEWNRIGSYWMDAENTSKYDGHDVLNLRARLQIVENLRLLSRIGNLTDELYAERATYNTFRGDEFAPGLPRTFNVTLQYGF